MGSERIQASDTSQVERAAALVHQLLARTRSLASLLDDLVSYSTPSGPAQEYPELFKAIMEAAALAVRRITDLSSRGSVSLPSALLEKLESLRNEITRDIRPLDATSLRRLRHHAVAAAEIVLSIDGENLKRLRVACIEATRQLERLVSTYDISRCREIVLATEHDLATLLDELRGVTSTDRADVHDLLGSVHAAVDEYRSSAERRGVDFIVKNECHRAMVNLPRDAVRKAIGGLLENAVKYTGDLPPRTKYKAPWITVVTKVQGDLATVDVESWGLPITEQELGNDLLFNYGYRGYFARGVTVGSGVGLNWIRSFVKRSGGGIAISTTAVPKSANPSNSTKTTVTLSFPLLAA
jgi:signal transduction histidine kinase